MPDEIEPDDRSQIEAKTGAHENASTTSVKRQAREAQKRPSCDSVCRSGEHSPDIAIDCPGGRCNQADREQPGDDELPTPRFAHGLDFSTPMQPGSRKGDILESGPCGPIPDHEVEAHAFRCSAVPH